jgi:hypothetical protein
MPITTQADERTLYSDSDHWMHVIDHLFVPAVEKAGFEAIRPSASGTSMIHGRIVQHLIESNMVLCDLSQHNPNVFFELGVRTSLNKPVALVKDEHRSIPFDTAGLNTHAYSSKLDIWDLPSQIEALATHLADSVRESDGTNPMWRHFGVAIAADRPAENLSPADARLELLVDRISGLEDRLERRTDSASALRPVGEQTPEQATQDLISDIVLAFPSVVSTTVNRGKYTNTYNLTVGTEKASADTQRSRAVKLSRALRDAGLSEEVLRTAPTEIVFRVTAPF